MSIPAKSLLLNNRVVAAVFLLLLLSRVCIAAFLPLLGDEAFYWQESRALALAYTDLPPLTAWLIAMGTMVGGDHVLGVRWPFLLIGALLPWVMRQWALRRLGCVDDANRVALFAMFMPLIATSGVLALPDVPLTLFMLLAFVFLDRAADTNRWRDWFWLGTSLALAALTHWRAAALGLAGLVWLLSSARGRDCLRSPGLWSALALALVGVMPILWFNVVHGWSALRFQLLERNPWSFQPTGIWIVPEQIALLTPLLAIVLLSVVIISASRRRRAPFDLMWSAAMGIVAMYIVIGFYADNERMRIHWPLPGYLPLLLAVPELLRDWALRAGWRRVLTQWTLPVAVAGSIITLMVLAAAASPSTSHRQLAARLLDTGFTGWEQAHTATLRMLERAPAGSILIADNFLLAAELDFALGGSREVYALDHPRNIKHGRQAQLAIWRRDQTSLLNTRWDHAVLVIELHARAPGERLAAWQALCRTFADVRWVAEERVSDAPVGFIFAEVTRLKNDQGRDCRAPVLAHIDFPLPDQHVAIADGLLVQGWAINDDVGVTDVTVLLDGVPIAAAGRRLPAPHVQSGMPHSTDPDHPDVGFRQWIAPALLRPGRRRVEIEVRSRARDDLPRRFGPIWVRVDRP